MRKAAYYLPNAYPASTCRVCGSFRAESCKRMNRVLGPWAASCRKNWVFECKTRIPCIGCDMSTPIDPSCWAAIDQLHRMPLLPADRPVVDLLVLGERFQFHGECCRSVDDALNAFKNGATHLVFEMPLAPADLCSLREQVPLPIYAKAYGVGPSIVELQNGDLLDEGAPARG
jgi:hypothetical protein